MLLAVAACATTHHLSEYEFQDKTLAAVYDFPPFPEVLTGEFASEGPADPVRDLVRAGTQLVKEIHAEELRARLDTASSAAAMPDRLAGRALMRTSRYLGTHIEEQIEHSDFLLEVNVREYGIDAEAWDSVAHFFIDSEATLLDRASGREIWHANIRESRPVTRAAEAGDRRTRGVMTVAALAMLSVDDLTLTLQTLADYCADEITRHLRHDLEKVR
jgi:hypothetical protein